MKTVRFLRDTDPHREGGPGFKSGQVHSLNPASARRWVIRGAAEYITDRPLVESKTYNDGTVATGVAPLPDQSPAEQAEEEAADGDVMDSAADVAGQDDSRAGERTEPVGEPAGSAASASARTSGRGRNQQHRGRAKGK